MQLMARVGQSHYYSCFNPHPARRPGATSATYGVRSTLLPFQSSPGQKAGCNLSRTTFRVIWARFQSSPGQKAGCNPSASLVMRMSGSCFNPHPARRPGATRRRRW